MIKLLLGSQPAIGGLITTIDNAFVTNTTDAAAISTAVIKMLSRNASKLNDPNLPNILSNTDLTTITDFAVLKEVLRESKLSLVMVDIISEFGDAENSGLSVIATNNNSDKVAKPGFIYHTNTVDLNELNIIKDIAGRFNLFPESLYPNCTFNTLLASEAELVKNGLTRNESSMVVLRNILTRLNISIDIYKR